MHYALYIFFFFFLLTYAHTYYQTDSNIQKLEYTDALDRATNQHMSAEIEDAFRRELDAAEYDGQSGDRVISVMVNLAAYLLNVGNHATDKNVWEDYYDECILLSDTVLELDFRNTFAKQNKENALRNKKSRDVLMIEESSCLHNSEESKDNKRDKYAFDDTSEHLQMLSELDLIPQSHKSYLLGLKAGGFNPQVIYDIGSCVLHWTKVAASIWPNATIILFDAFEPAEFLYNKHGYTYYMGLLSDIDGSVKQFYQNDKYPGGSSYYREIAHNGHFFPPDKFITKTATTLDTIVRNRKFPRPDLIKIDTQGSELDILKGAENTLLTTKHLIIEMQHNQYNMGAPLATHSIPVVQKYGFELVANRFSDNGDDADYAFQRTSTDSNSVPMHL